MICLENFEMYCMLYADGELSPVEIQEFQAFLAANPDLEPEWNRWQQLKLSAPAIQFPFPEQLMQPGNTEISEADAWLYIDGELSTSEKNRIDTILNTNATARKSVQELTALKLVPDPVACPDKASLYKKEKAPRIIAFRTLLRFAAAACIGWLLYTYFPSVSKPITTPTVVGNQPNDIRQFPSQDLNATPKKDAVQPNLVTVAHPANPTSHSLVTNTLNTSLPPSDKIVTNTITNLNATNNTLSKTDPVQPMVNIPAPPSATALENVATQLPEDKVETIIPAQKLVYKELDIQSTRETITIGTMEIREGKVRGIIRRAQALFKNKNSSSTQPADEYKVLPAVQIIQN